MTITLPPNEEARLVALAKAKGLSAEALVHQALDRILADADTAVDAPPEHSTGAALIAALQSSPFREIDLEPARSRFPIRDVVY